MYRGIAGGVDQNAGQSQSKIYNDGSKATIGLGGVERALNDGFSVSQIQEWIDSVQACVGEKAQEKYGLVASK